LKDETNDLAGKREETAMLQKRIKEKTEMYQTKVSNNLRDNLEIIEEMRPMLGEVITQQFLDSQIPLKKKLRELTMFKQENEDDFEYIVESMEVDDVAEAAQATADTEFEADDEKEQGLVSEPASEDLTSLADDTRYIS
jgi:hypothetical protein